MGSGWVHPNNCLYGEVHVAVGRVQGKRSQRFELHFQGIVHLSSNRRSAKLDLLGWNFPLQDDTTTFF